VQGTSFIQNETILRALEFAVAKGGFGGNAKQKKAAVGLIQQMKSNKSVSGRHQQLMSLLAKGATIEQLMKSTTTSRRTVFRYLNHFEDAGVEIQLTDGKYKLK
jgi:hypothetical protein